MKFKLILFVEDNSGKDIFGTDRHIITTTNDGKAHLKEALFQVKQMFLEYFIWERKQNR